MRVTLDIERDVSNRTRLRFRVTVNGIRTIETIDPKSAVNELARIVSVQVGYLRDKDKEAGR